MLNYRLLRDSIEQKIILTDFEWKKIIDKIELVRFEKNAFFQNQEDTSKYEGFVLKGSFKIYTIDENGSDNVLFFAFDGDWVCDIDGFYNQTKSKYNIKAIEQSELIVINRKNKMLLFEEVPKMLQFHTLMMQRATVVMQNRLLAALNKTAKERYIEFITKYPNKVKNINNRTLSSYLGVSEEFLSKIKKNINVK